MQYEYIRLILSVIMPSSVGSSQWFLLWAVKNYLFVVISERFIQIKKKKKKINEIEQVQWIESTSKLPHPKVPDFLITLYFKDEKK